MNILVIGGNGFIGSHLVDYLLVCGHKVRVFDVSYERYREPLSDVEYRISNLENTPDLYEAMLGIETIFYLASASVPSTSNVDIISDINKNLMPLLNVLNLSVKMGIMRFVYFSSGGAVYGVPLTEKISEEHPLHPISSYGIVKATVENYLLLYQRLYGIVPLILRPSNPFGPRQGHFMAQGVISTFLRKIKDNESISVFGDGTSKKDYIYIKDLVKLCCDLTFTGECGIYNIGSGIGTSINEIICYIKNVTNIDMEVNYLDKQIYDVEHFVLDISKIMSFCSICEFTSMEIGIKDTWNWILTNSN
ncbi:NAD-dependent epimerase/dehydratase family protein [Dysgonomonas sp.]